MTTERLIARAELDEETARLATAGAAPRDFIQQLAQGRERAAVSAMAQALPKSQSIAWALEAIRHRQTSPKPAEAAALATIDDWLKDPTDDRRRAAYAAAREAGFGSPAGCLGLAVFLSGGSMAPVTAPVAPEPQDHLCGRAVAGAILIAAVLDPANAAAHLRGFLARGFQIADELKIWEEK